jgi:16S rRNA (cytosine967-C5)-methyltransferase
MKARPPRSGHRRSQPVLAHLANGRELSFVVLDEYRRTARFAAQLLEEQTQAASFSDNDRRFAREIVYGVIRRRSTLNRIIGQHLDRPRHAVEGALWTLLQLGTYQLLFLASVPARAAVHATVEIAARLGMPQWKGLLNGVLRAIARSLTDEMTDRASPAAVPIAEGRYRLCTLELFPDVRVQPCAYFTQAFSLPEWLIERWLKRFDFEEIARLGFWFNAPARPCLRVNTLKTTRSDLLTELIAAGVDAVGGDDPASLHLMGGAMIEQLPGFGQGWFSVQDESALAVARLLSPTPGEMMLDLCAGVGGKTTHLAELMRNQGSIVATDPQPERLERLERNASRLGIGMIQTKLINCDGTDLPGGMFDGILVDVPCSNTGVLGKRPEARWRIQPSDLAELPVLQSLLLAAACERVKPGGRIVYSTCSIEPEENSAIVRDLLRTREQFRLLKQIEHSPGKPADGGYQALLVRAES